MLLITNVLLVLLTTPACKSTPEYIYVQPECSIPARKTLTDVDSGVLYDVLMLPHSLMPLDVNTLIPELPSGYDGNELFYILKGNQTLLVDMILEREAVLREVCKNGK